MIGNNVYYVFITEQGYIFSIFSGAGGISFLKIWEKNLIKGKRKEGKKKKRGKKEKKGGKKKKRGEKEKKSIRGRIMKKSDTWNEGGKKTYFPPICTVPTWGKKISFWKGGGEILLGEIYTPVTE